MLKVSLLTYTPEPEKLIAGAAKLCYSSSGINDIFDALTDEKVASFMEMLSDIGHESPIEHANFTFGIEGVSRSLLAQLTRHRIASFSVQSQRYVREEGITYVLPPEIEAIPEAKEEFLLAMKEDEQHYNNLTNILSEHHYNRLVKAGINQKQAMSQAEKLAIEDARFVLPNASTTKMILTMNARSLINLFHHRCCNRAQWEIRDLAWQMLGLVCAVAPSLFAKVGPVCLFAKCPEGKMCCGKMDDVRERFEQLMSNNEN